MNDDRTIEEIWLVRRQRDRCDDDRALGAQGYRPSVAKEPPVRCGASSRDLTKLVG